MPAAPRQSSSHIVVAGNPRTNRLGRYGAVKGAECLEDTAVAGSVTNRFGDALGVTCCDADGLGSRPGCRSARPLPLRWQPQPRMAAPLPIEQIITDSLDRHAQRLQKLLPSEEPRLVRLQDATADDWRLVIDALAPFLKEKKLRSYQDVLGRRRVALQILIENVADPHNAQAAPRTVCPCAWRCARGAVPAAPETDRCSHG